jgi:hypothetical protein
LTTSYDERKKLHYDLLNVELRAQATAVGVVQICIELQRANVLDQAAIERIKDAIADEVSLNAPRSIGIHEYRSEIKARLDRLFTGEEMVGSAAAMSFDDKDDMMTQ